MAEWLVVGWLLSVGIVPMQDKAVEHEWLQLAKPTTYAEVGVSFEFFEFLTIEATIENYQAYYNAVYFMPYLVNYVFEATAQFGENVAVYFYHNCTHPILSSMDYQVGYPYMENETRIGIMFSGSTK
jgi:hypothetical protein